MRSKYDLEDFLNLKKIEVIVFKKGMRNSVKLSEIKKIIKEVKNE